MCPASQSKMVGVGGRTRFCQIRDAPIAPAAAPRTPAAGIAHIQGLCGVQAWEGRPEGTTGHAWARIPQKWPLRTMTRTVIVMAAKPANTAAPTTMTPRENRPTRSTYELSPNEVRLVYGHGR
jgi:hypothetical protein